MKFVTIVASMGLALASGLSYAEDNAKLKQLYESDQWERKPTGFTIDPGLVEAHDRDRREAVLDVIRRGEPLTANDYYHAATVFQHGSTAEDNALAYSLALLASRLDASNSQARWLAAAAWDRSLMRRNKPQWYGTQYVKNQSTGKWELYQIDEAAVSDAERERNGVPSISKAKERVKSLNGE